MGGVIEVLFILLLILAFPFIGIVLVALMSKKGDDTQKFCDSVKSHKISDKHRKPRF